MSQKIQVLSFLQTLPKNRVTTYKALAQKFSTHPRAIATYMRTNKELDTYPCYKVVASNGGLSGYVLGLEEKIRRLKNDGIEIDGEKIKVDYIITNFI